jgi:hypothetical protein
MSDVDNPLSILLAEPLGPEEHEGYTRIEALRVLLPSSGSPEGVYQAPVASQVLPAPTNELPPEANRVLNKISLKQELDRHDANTLLRNMTYVKANKVKRGETYQVFFVEPSRYATSSKRPLDTEDEEEWSEFIQVGSSNSGALGEKGQPPYQSPNNQHEGVLRISGTVPGELSWAVGSVYRLVILPGHPNWIDEMDEQHSRCRVMEGRNFKYLNGKHDRYMYKLVSRHDGQIWVEERISPTDVVSGTDVRMLLEQHHNEMQKLKHMARS